MPNGKIQDVETAIREALHKQIDNGKAKTWEVVNLLRSLAQEFENRDQKERNRQERAYLRNLEPSPLPRRRKDDKE